MKLTVRNTFARICIVALFSLSIGLSALDSLAAGQETKRVFVLNSYHRGYPFSDNAMRGIDDAFGKSGIKVETYITYMDMKRIPTTPQYFSKLKELIRVGYKGARFDAVIACDNDALEFIRKYRDELFPGVPVVFTGINDFDKRMLGGRSDITGISQSNDYAGTIRIAQKFRPATKDIVVVTDNTTTGMAHRSAIVKIRPDFPQSLGFTYISLADMTLDELAEKLSKLNSDSIVLLLHHFVDRNGTGHSIQESTSLLAKSSSVPIFVVSDIRMGFGTLGGHLVGGYSQGEAAAQIAVNILGGTDVRTIPVLLESPNRFMFDYNVMKRFSIAEGDLPQGSIMINKPVSVLEAYRPQLFAILGTFIVLSGILVYMLLEIWRRKRAEEALCDSERNYRSIYEDAVLGIYQATPEGKFINANAAFARMAGYDSPEEFIDAIKDIGTQLYVNSEERQIFIEIITAYGMIEGFEVEFFKKDRSIFWILVNARVVKDKQGRVIYYEGIAADVTQRKQAEEALRESETLQRTLLANLPAGAIIIDPVTRMIENVNNTAAAMFGVRAEHIVGHRCHAFLCPANEGACPVCDLGKEVDNAEREMVCADGSRRPVLKSVKRVQMRGKEKLLECFVDITERKRAEEALLESEEKYRLIAENSTDVIWTMNLDGRFTYVSPSVTMHAGYTPEEAMAMTLDTYLYKEDLPWVMEEIARDLQKPREQRSNRRTLEVRQYKKDGSVLNVEVSVAWLYNERGETVGLQGSTRDISARKQAEGALHEQEIKLSSIFRAAPVGIGMVVNRVFQESNDMLCQMTGYSREELLGRNARMLYPTQDDYDYVGQEKYRQIHEKSTGTVETCWQRKDGRVIDIILSSTPLDPDDLAKGVTFTALDITARKQAEEEKRSLEQRLQHADKMESIGTLAGGIAHDFNNLLMGIQGYASLSLMNLDPSHPNYERLRRIEEQVQSGADLTKQLLGFARGGRYEVKPTDMNDIIEKTSTMFGRTKKEIMLHRKYGKGLRPVEVDQGQMDQVFMNLYVNAWQAMPGGGEIYLETENVILDDEQAFPSTFKPGKYVKITVTDTGTGMDEKTKVRIFDPFFTTKEMGRGTGLGLATVYGIIKGHKGMINVYSEPGHGTTFTIYLPASEKEVVQEKTVTGTIARGTETILLVDDEKMVVEVTRELLESLGYRVYAAGSGQEAIAVYMEKRSKIDLVILDMVMPGISGGETYNRLKEISPDIRFLLSSGYSINGEAQSIINRGCNGFIQKPFQLEKLSRSVREAID
jgi:two-component system, cell cycle sensor histidine kinase and response regulator CckA